MATEIEILKEYVATANSGKYNSWEEINSKFPELKDYDAETLKEYVATANSGKYKSWEEIDVKFPEFEPLKKKASTEPTQTDLGSGGTSGAFDVQSTESEVFKPKRIGETEIEGEAVDIFQYPKTEVKESPFTDELKATLKRLPTEALVAANEIKKLKRKPTPQELQGIQDKYGITKPEEVDALTKYLEFGLKGEKTIEPSAIDYISNAWQRGTNNARLSSYINMGRMPSEEELKTIAEINRFELPTSKITEKFNNAPDFNSAIKELAVADASDFGLWLAENVVQSFGALWKGSPKVAERALQSGAVGAGVGTAIPAIGTAAGAMTGAGYGYIVGMGEQSANLEYANTFISTLAESGVDITDEKSLKEALNNEGLIKEAKRKALLRGVPVGFFDGLSAGIGGKIVTQPGKSAFGKMAKALAEPVVQAGLGGAGAATGQLASEGKITDGKEIFTEIVAEFGTSPVEILTGSLRNNKLKAEKKPYSVSKNKTELFKIFKGATKEEIDFELARQVALGKITEDQKQMMSDLIMSMNEADKVTPQGMPNRDEAVVIISEKKELEKEAENVDTAFQPIIQEKISELETELKQLVSGTAATPTVIEPIQPTTTTAQEQGVEETVSESVSQVGDGTTETTTTVLDPLKDVESTAKALLENGISPTDIQKATGVEMNKGNISEYREFSEAYHKAKADGSNPELVKAVEELLTPKIEQDAKEQQSGQMREQGVQDQPQRKGDSDMPIVNEAELQDGGAVEEEVVGREIQPNKQVSIAQGKAIKDVTTNLNTDLKDMEANMLFSKFRDNVDEQIEVGEGLTAKQFESLEKKGYVEQPSFEKGEYVLTEKGKQFIDRVKARIETRRGVKLGTDMFPELANIPEFKPIQETIQKEIDNGTITEEAVEQYGNKTEPEIESNEAIVEDIERKAESDNETELNEVVRQSNEIIGEETEATPIRNAFVKRQDTIETSQIFEGTDGLQVGDYIRTETGTSGFVTKVNPKSIMIETLYGGYGGKDAQLMEIKLKKSDVAQHLKQKREADSTTKPQAQPLETKPKTTKGISIGEEITFPFAGGTVTAKVTDIVGDTFKAQEADGTKHTVKQKDVIGKRQQLEDNVKQAEAELKKAREDRNKQGKNLGVIFDPESQAEADIKVLSKLKDYVVAKLKLGAYDLKTFFADMKRMGIEVSKDTEQKWNEWFINTEKENNISPSITIEQIASEGKEKLVKSGFSQDQQQVEERIIGSAGFINFGLPNFGFIPNGVSKKLSMFLKEYFTSKGLFTSDIFERKIKMDSALNSRIRQIRYTAREFRSAIEKVSNPKAVAKQVDKFLKGNLPISSLPLEVQEVAQNMRNEIDALSREMISKGIVDGALQGIVAGNMGIYVTRSYKVHEDPISWKNFIENTPEGQLIKNKAVAFINNEYAAKGITLTSQEIDGIINELLYVPDAPMALIKGAKVGSKDLSILIKRKDIAPEIRALLGEYDDPLLNYSKSVLKSVNLIEKSLFLNDIKGIGMGVFLFEKPIGEHYVAIAGDGSKTMSPLNGLYTTPELAKAFSDFDASPNYGFIFQAYMAVNGYVKYAKTVLSVMTHIRNLLGNIGFAMMNSHYRIDKAANAAKTTIADNFSGRTMLTDNILEKLGIKDKKQWQEKYKKYVELGVVYDNANAGEVYSIIKDASDQDYEFEKFIDNRIVKVKNKITKGVQAMYMAEDDVWKIYAFENEYARYKKAYPNLTEEQVAEKAANIVRNTYPTYSLIPKAVKEFRKIPFFGTFVSFPAEVIRTSFNTVELAFSEMKNPETRNIGSQRLAGIMLAATATGTLALASRAMVGIGADDEEDKRMFLAPWDKNGQLVWIDKDTYINMSYTDPHNYLKVPLRVMLQKGDKVENTITAIAKIFEPFLGEEILMKAVREAMSNTKDGGGQVYNPELSLADKAMQISEHFSKTLEPGTVSSFKRIWEGVHGNKSESGTVYDAKEEIISTFTGHRIKSLDVEKSMYFKSKEYSDKINNSKYIYNKTLRQDISDEERAEALEKANEALKKNLLDLHEFYSAAIRLGIDKRKMLESFKTHNISKENIRIITTGVYKDWRPKKQI